MSDRLGKLPAPLRRRRGDFCELAARYTEITFGDSRDSASRHRRRMTSVKADHDVDGVRSVPVARRRRRQQITKSAEIRHRWNNGNPCLAGWFIEALKRFRYTQLLRSDIDVMDTCT